MAELMTKGAYAAGIARAVEFATAGISVDTHTIQKKRRACSAI